MLTPEIKALMNRTGELVTDKMVDTLISNGSLATGALARGISYQVVDTEDGGATRITIPGYGEFVDKGRRAGAKMPPVQPIIDWVRVKRIKTPQITTEQMGWAIAKSIAKKGIRPKPFIQNSIDFVLNNFVDQLDEAGKEDLNNAIIAEFQKLPGIKVTQG
jgi:hypothetical protein